MPTYIDLILSRLPPRPFRGSLAEGFAGLVGGLMANLVAEAASIAIQALWLVPGQPEENFAVQAGYRRLRRYIVETAEQYRARLERAVEIWEGGGSEDELEAQFDAAGYAGTTIHSPLDWNRPPYDWFSEFWALIPREAHLDGSAFHVCGSGVLCGAPDAICGTGTIFKHAKNIGAQDVNVGNHLIGITGPEDHIVELQHIVRTFKSGHEICRQILIEIEGHVCGDGSLAGSEVCGGTVVAIGMGVAEQ